MLNQLLIPNTKNKFRPILIRKLAIFIYTLIFAFVNLAPDFLFESISPVSASSITAEKIVELTNVERQKYGLSALKINSKLSSAARAKANDMLLKQYWDHFGPSGETPWQFIEGADYNYIYAGENLAKGFSSSEGVHLAWMASSSHRKNIISGNYKEIGIAVVDGKLLDEDVTLVVQMFGNQTDRVEQASVKAVTQKNFDSYQSIEEGEIKSISISYPGDGEILNNARAHVKGEVNFAGRLPDYEVIVYSDGKELGEAKSDSVDWNLKADQDWSEGDHSVIAQIGPSNQLLDTVNFMVDTYPPIIHDHDIAVKLISNVLDEDSDRIMYKWQVDVKIYDEIEDINLVIDDEVYSLETQDSNLYKVKAEHFLPKSEKVESAVLLAIDDVGNSSEIDITHKFINEIKNIKDDANAGFVRRSIGSIVNPFKSVAVRNWINIALAMFILALLILEVYFYHKIGRLADNSMFLFFLGIWWILIFFSIVVGFDGSTFESGISESVVASGTMN